MRNSKDPLAGFAMSVGTFLLSDLLAAMVPFDVRWIDVSESPEHRQAAFALPKPKFFAMDYCFPNGLCSTVGRRA